jgi:hypothetical protein
MHGGTLVLLLALAGCVEADRPGPAVVSVPHDARGQPIFNAIMPQSPADTAATPGVKPAKIESCTHRRRCP